ncbi:unnamed protein product [Diplocarpon coronariae]
MRSISPVLLPEQCSASTSYPHLQPPPTRPDSCPMPDFLAPKRPPSPDWAQDWNSSHLTPYAFPTRQPQPHSFSLPLSTGATPRPTRVQLVRDGSSSYRRSPRRLSSLGVPALLSPLETQELLRSKTRPSTLRQSRDTSPLELVYSIYSEAFTLERRDTLLHQTRSSGTGTASVHAVPMIEMREDRPPLLVDGRMTIVQIPRWRKSFKVYWRRGVMWRSSKGKPLTNSEGEETMVWEVEVKLPGWVWAARNCGVAEWRECFVRAS